jgi:hypothetical protein
MNCIGAQMRRSPIADAVEAVAFIRLGAVCRRGQTINLIVPVGVIAGCVGPTGDVVRVVVLGSVLAVSAGLIAAG